MSLSSQFRNVFPDNGMAIIFVAYMALFINLGGWRTERGVWPMAGNPWVRNAVGKRSKGTWTWASRGCMLCTYLGSNRRLGR